MTVEAIRAGARDAATRYQCLVLVVGGNGEEAANLVERACSSEGWGLVNVGLALSERLLELSKRQRALRASRILEDLASAEAPDVVALTNLELLFAAELELDPLRLLQKVSRHRTVIAGWPGHVDGDAIAYAEPGHPEYRRYCAPDAVVVQAASVIPK